MKDHKITLGRLTDHENEFLAELRELINKHATNILTVSAINGLMLQVIVEPPEE